MSFRGGSGMGSDVRAGSLRRVVAGAAVSVLLGCHGASPPVEEAVVRTDSAGVELVESRAPLWSAAEAWRVAGDPELVVGRRGGPEDLYGVRAATRLVDGRIVIAEHGSSALRYFDASGHPLHAVGGPGQGPGEFTSVGEMWRARDSLYVFEYASFRMSVFSVDGAFGRILSFAPGREGRLSLPEAVLPDGSILVSRGRADLGAVPGLDRDTLRYSLRDAEGGFLHEIATLPGPEYYLVSSEGRTMLEPRPFGLEPGVAAGGARLYYGTASEYRIEVYSTAGVLERVFLRPLERRSPSPEHIDAFRRDLAEADASNNPMARAIARHMELPESMPAHGSLRLDSDGNLWVAEYAPAQEDQHVWSVFHPGGTWLGDVETEPGGEILEIGHDYLLGVWRDAFDVEEVRLYRIVKPG